MDTSPITQSFDERRLHMVPLILLLGLVSGGVALSYEVLWGRELLNVLGSTTRASAVVLTAFMGGIAIGAWFAGRWSPRSTRPLLLFAAAEVLLAVIGFSFPRLLDTVVVLLPGITASSAFLIALLLAPAFLMGIALPALAAALQGYGAVHSRYVAWLYGLNTLGGAVAALAVGLGALPEYGLLASERAISAVGLFTAVVAAGFASKWPAEAFETTRLAAPRETDAANGRAWAAAMAALFLGGVAALGYQVLWTRILVLVVGSSSNAFTLMLGLYLAGLALGGFLVGKLMGRIGQPAVTYQFLQLGVAVTALSGLAVFGLLPAAALTGFAWLGTSPASIALINILVAAVVILPPTIFIGAAFPVAARLMERGSVRRGREVGLALALTTAGNVAGILLTALVVIPLAGLQMGIAILVVFNLAAAFLLWVTCRRPAAERRYLVPLAALGGLIVIPMLPSWDVSVMTSGVFRQAPVYLALLGSPQRLERAFFAYGTRYYREGREAVVGVFDRPTLDGLQHRVLTIDGKVDASTGADMATQILSGHLPFMFRPDARNALVIGLASGVTVGALAEHKLEQIEVVEIEPAVIEASRAFDAASGAPLDDPRVAITVADGRRFLRATQRRFDVIVSEPSNPWLSMSARLFTREFFTLIRDHLAPGGVLVQWLPLYGLSSAQFEALLRTMLDVFPEMSLFQVAEGDLVAIAGSSRMSVDPASVAQLFKDGGTVRPEAAGVYRPADLLGRWIADAAGLRAVLGVGPLNTDDNGLLEFGSPWYVLSDTRLANLSLVERAWERSGIPRQIVAIENTGNGQDGFFVALASHYLSRDRPDMVRSLAAAMRSSGAVDEADLLAGDAANAEGRWQEAEALWEPHDASPFRLRRARLAYRLGDLAKAARLFASVRRSEFVAEDNILFALTLAGTGHPQGALDILDATAPNPDTVAGIIAPFIKSMLLRRLGPEEKVLPQRRRFEKRLDGLRRCLEIDGCGSVAKTLIQWGNGIPPGMESAVWDRFRQSLFLRVTRPLPHFFEAVRSLWLGDRDVAMKSLRTYLGLLPESDPLSKAHEFIDDSRAFIDGKKSPGRSNASYGSPNRSPLNE